jgi:hypothetical protein
VQNQREKLCVWAKIRDPKDAREEEHILRVIMTGEEFIDPMEELYFINTVQMAGGSLVLHVFEEL